ncbi:MAG TPA: HEAT repeat domain-containing protein, partial [Opitutaceae bacterium]|nr:HEAT repeat domain-containing protein [Opitutaceae bacterium]
AMTRRRLGEEGIKELSIEGEILRLVEDTNGDGVADRSSVYADGFNTHLDGIASGVLARRGEVFFTNIPSLWKFTGAQRAETRTKLSRGYGIRYNFTGHDFHGLVFGPDGKIYFSNGDRGTHVKTKEGGIVDMPDTGAVFRCNPDGSQLEIVAWGLRNPQSLLFTENGDLLTGDNDSDQGDEERLVHVVEGGDSGWRIGYQFAPLEKAGPWNSEKLWHQRHPGQPAYIIPPVANVEDGPSGIVFYPGTGLNPSYRGSIFLTHFKGAIARSGIYTYNLKVNGASYDIADSKPFLTYALPTDARFGPDGRLYISDWAEGWPKSKRGRIYAISDPKHASDPIVKETQQLIGSDWTKKSLDELGNLLAHPDWRVRLEAQFTLAECGDASIPVFAKVASAHAAEAADIPSPLALSRRHAVWGLGQVAPKNFAALAPVRALVKDPDAEVRAQAIKVLGDHATADFAETLLAALNDENARVKFFAGQSLGKLGRVQPEFSERIAAATIEALRANDDKDALVRHAGVMALAGARHIPTLSAAAADRSRAVRLGAVLALRRLGHADAQKFLADADPSIVREAAIAINDEPINAALPALAALLDRPRGTGSLPVNSEDAPTILRAINAHFRLGQPANVQALASYAARADAPAEFRVEALSQLALWTKPPQRDRIVGVYRPLGLSSPALSPSNGSNGHTVASRDRADAANALLPILPDLLAAHTPSPVQTAALVAQQNLEIAGASDTLFRVVGDEQQPGASRAAALGALDKIDDPRLLEAVRIASTSGAAELRLAALPVAARLSPEASAPVLANLVAHGDSAERRAAFRALGRLKHPSADTLLAEQLRALEAGKVDPAAQLELLNAAGRRESAVVKDLLAQREAKFATNPDPLAPYRFALEG